MNWTSIFQFVLAHVLPVLAAGGGGYLAGGRRRAVSAAADNATDQSLDAALRKIRDDAEDRKAQLPSAPGDDEPTRPQ